MAAPAISIRHLLQSYQGREVLSVPELDIEPGAMLTLLGPNGSGKSTLLRLLGLLETPKSGRIAYHGRVPATARERLEQRRHMVMVFQDPLLFKGTVYDNVAYGLRLRKTPRHLERQRVHETLELLGLGSLVHRGISGLSGGEAQKAALARALVLQPTIMFLDEPTAYLDAPTRQSFCTELLSLLDALKITAVFVTHDRNEARRMSRAVAVLLAGRLEQLGPAEEVFQRPASAQLAAFLGVENLFPAMAYLDNGVTRLRASGLELLATAATGGAVTVGLRPQDLHLDAHDVGYANVMGGTVRSLVPQDAAWRLVVDCGVPLVVYVSEHEARRRGLGPGQVVRLSVDPERVLVYPGPDLS